MRLTESDCECETVSVTHCDLSVTHSVNDCVTQSVSVAHESDSPLFSFGALTCSKSASATTLKVIEYGITQVCQSNPGQLVTAFSCDARTRSKYNLKTAILR